MPDPTADEVVLHLGAGKTGTSSLQYRLGANRGVLSAAGTLYPRTPGGARHTRLGVFAKSDEEMVGTGAWSRLGGPDPRQFRRRFRRRLLREVVGAGAERVLFSDEALFALAEDPMRRVQELAREIAPEVRAVVYLRRQDDRLVSRYQQVVKAGSTKTLSEWAGGYGASVHDYHQRLVAWRSVLGESALVVRRFERSAFVNGDLYDDFLAAAGIPLSAGDLAPVEIRNESLDAEAVEFLRILNLYRVEAGLPVGVTDNAPLVERLRERPPGLTLTLPAGVLDREMERWESSNQATAREFLGADDGALFREPRRSGVGTTTEQALDPAHLDDLCDLVELPTEVRDRLRLVAEREATARRSRA